VIVDVDFEFLEQGVRLIDAQLNRLQQEARGSPDPDAFGDFDRMEYIGGLGFVICQQYLSARAAACRLTKTDALQAGPVHRSGIAIAVAVNDAANYWKHAPEWGSGPFDPRARATRERLETLGIDLGQSYVMSAVLAALAVLLVARRAGGSVFVPHHEPRGVSEAAFRRGRPRRGG
jgi:hypothetical protein